MSAPLHAHGAEGATRVVVTGIGVVSPNGLGKQAFWQNARDHRSCLRRIERFDCDDYDCRVAGEVADFRPEDHMEHGIRRQTDRSAQMAFAACGMAMEDAAIDASREDPYRVGMYFANVFGGMEFAEPELFNQHHVSPSRVSAYQSIAWFFAACQGQWSIAKGLKGHGKSIVADRVGGHQALLMAALAIRQGRADIVFAGGFEAPLAPYVFRIHESTGLLNTTARSGEGAYAPFDSRRRGMVLGEAAAVLVLEERGRAEARGAHIYAELAGGAMTNAGARDGASDHADLARCLNACLDNSGMRAGDVGCVMPEGLANAAGDRREAAALHEVFAPSAPRVCVPKATTGHTLAASGAMDAAWAAMMIDRREFLPGGRIAHPQDGCGLTVDGDAGSGRGPDAVLCFGSGHAGVHTGLILRRAA